MSVSIETFRSEYGQEGTVIIPKGFSERVVPDDVPVYFYEPTYTDKKKGLEVRINESFLNLDLKDQEAAISFLLEKNKNSKQDISWTISVGKNPDDFNRVVILISLLC